MVHYIIGTVTAIAISSIIMLTCSCSEEDQEEQVKQEQQKCTEDAATSFQICVAHVKGAHEVDVKTEIEGCDMKWEARRRACCLPRECE